MTRIAVTGARGFIGARIMRALPGATALTGDVREAGTFAGDFDVLIHCAGALPAHFDIDPARAWTTNVEGTARATEAAARRNAHLILASSSGVYAPAADPIPETAPVAPIGRYGESKAEAERIAAGAPAATILRLFNPYGRGQSAANLIGYFTSAAAIRLRAPDDRRDFVHVGDVVRAFLMAKPGVYNVGTGTSHSVREVAGMVRARSTTPLEIACDPPTRPPQTYCADVAHIASALGWRTEISLDRGLDEAMGLQTLP